MIVAIMQPYFFPYIGYFQLMAAVDLFIIYDDAQYMKGGWINRNRIRLNNKPKWATLPVRHDHFTLAINKRHYLLESGVERLKQQLMNAYAIAPFANESKSFICSCFSFTNDNIAKYNTNLLRLTARLCGINCRIEFSSRIGANSDLTGQNRVLDICRRVGATHYVNPMGGREIYDVAKFKDLGIGLSFLNTTTKPAELSDGPVHLSILDHLLMEGVAGTSDRMGEYQQSEPQE